MKKAEILNRLFEMSGLSQEEFIRQTRISTSQFYKIISQAKSECPPSDCYLSTVNNWVATSAAHIEDLHDEWLNLVFKLYLDETIINRLVASSAKTKSPWYKSVLENFFPDSVKLLKK